MKEVAAENRKIFKLQPGRAVQIAGIRSRPDLNGSFGVLVDFKDSTVPTKKGRWKVALQ